jgi:hypothetical protein
VSRYSCLAGTSGTATVPSGCVVTSIRAHSSAGGSLVITLADGTVLQSIPLPAGAEWLKLDFIDSLRELCGGATLVFTSTDAYVVSTRQIGGG